MKLYQSSTTTYTKLSHNKIYPIKNSKENQEKVGTVFVNHQKRLYSIKVIFSDLTVEEMTLRAIRELQNRYGLTFDYGDRKWLLYPSKQSGKKCNDYPDLQPNQRVELIGINCFFLGPDKNQNVIGKIASDY